MFRRACHTLIFTVLLGACGALTGCDDRGPTIPLDGGNPDDESTLRIVSLAPALTQMIIDMGKADALVGISENDMAAPTGLTVVGNYQNINTEALLSVYPTHVLTMTGKQAIPNSLARLASSKRFMLVSYPSPSSVLEISRIIFDERELVNNTGTTPGKSLGVVLDSPRAALHASMQMSIELAHLSSVTADATRPRVLMVIGIHPLMASGPGTVLDQLLSFCGGQNAAGSATVGAPVYDKEKLIEADPEVILLLLPGAPPLESIESDPRLAQLRGLPIPAVKNARIVLINDPLVHLPSTSLSRIGVQITKAIHPDLAQRIDQALESNFMAAPVPTPQPADPTTRPR